VSVEIGVVDVTLSMTTLPGWSVRGDTDTVSGLPSCPATWMLDALTIRANVTTTWRTLCEVLRTILTG
jgi:hypothetical protein